MNENGESKEMFTTDKKYTRCKRLAYRVALEYCLKDSPCCTEWIDVCYKCIRDLIWIRSHYMDTCAFMHVHEIAPLTTIIEAYLLTNGYKTNPSIIKRRFLPANTAISRLINSSPSVMN